jgi:hypothetical protein
MARLLQHPRCYLCGKKPARLLFADEAHPIFCSYTCAARYAITICGIPAGVTWCPHCRDWQPIDAETGTCTACAYQVVAMTTS